MNGPTREQIVKAILHADTEASLSSRTDATSWNLAAAAIQALYAPLVEEVKRLRQWVHDLQAGMYINCVYCGHRYGPDDQVPATMAQALKEHVEQCSQHPMAALREENERLRADLALAWPIARAANFEALRAQHDLSFADPPSYHDDCGGGVLVCEKCNDTILGQIWRALHALTPDQRARLLEERA